MQWHIENFWNITEKHLDALDYTAFSCHKEETEQSCGTRCVFFYCSNTGLSTHCYSLWKRLFGGEGAVWYPVWVYIYLKVGTTHFYHLALCNLVLGLTNILLKSKLFRWWMSYCYMTDYGHATIIGVLLGKII